MGDNANTPRFRILATVRTVAVAVLAVVVAAQQILAWA